MDPSSGFVDASGVVETESGHGYEPRGTRVNSREQVTPDDISFWVNKVLAPKYGLDDLNANNVASFLKELEVNWAKLPTELKDKVVDLMVEQIFPMNYEFKEAIMSRVAPMTASPMESETADSSVIIKESFGMGTGMMGFKKIHLIIVALIVIGVGAGMVSGVIPNPFAAKKVPKVPMY